MISKKVLVAFGSRWGSTEGIAYELSMMLKHVGLNTTVINLRQINHDHWPAVDEFGAIILGTGIRIGQWTKEVKEYLKKNKEKLVKGEITLGFFISCGYASDPKYYPIAIRDFIEKGFRKIGIKPDMYEAFGGIFDYSDNSKLTSLDRKILRLGARDLCMKIGFNDKNDYRNWERVREFSTKINRLVG
ncbi:MAG: Protoporphyrinogen IX dehydrogenase [menaquinone] [Candidatus Heimdallarchaeota archaeon LC_3]|nr:MAG: Protoporphyrinogen IX dehydrogenase [menaquinone] [Candidatus Heimdallarchaeota archaeon LC_3]